jgi:hypothetical protein
MGKNRFLSLFDLLFRYPDRTESHISQINRLQSRLRSGRCSSKKVLSEFDTLHKQPVNPGLESVHNIQTRPIKQS